MVTVYIEWATVANPDTEHGRGEAHDYRRWGAALEKRVQEANHQYRGLLRHWLVYTEDNLTLAPPTQEDDKMRID